MTSAALRAQFPILERVAYLNAGTDGPVPRAAQEAVARELASELGRGAGGRTSSAGSSSRMSCATGYAELLGARSTTSR